jgi:hypothetical protein
MLLGHKPDPGCKIAARRERLTNQLVQLLSKALTTNPPANADIVLAEWQRRSA